MLSQFGASMYYRCLKNSSIRLSWVKNYIESGKCYMTSLYPNGAFTLHTVSPCIFVVMTANDGLLLEQLDKVRVLRNNEREGEQSSHDVT